MKIKKDDMPWDFWNYNINPILGYRYAPPQNMRGSRDKFEFPPEDDYNPNTEDNR